MCAGKLLSLIKKCLHREKSGQKCDCNGNASSTTTSTTSSTSAGTCKSTAAGQKPMASVTKKKVSSGTGASVPGCCMCQHQYCHSTGLSQHVGMSQATMAMTTAAGYCRLCSCCSGSTGPPEHTQAHGHLGTHCCTPPCNNPVVYVPSTPMDPVEREVARQREHQQRLQAIQTDMELNLPPRISISEDGEEGYAQSQRLLQLSCQQRTGESIRPPPNKTVFQGDSPPPYRSNSVSKIEGHYYNKRGGGGGGGGLHHQSFPPASCVSSKHMHQQQQHQQACGGGGSGSGSPFIPRCHSISSTSGDKRLPPYTSHQARHSVLPSCGHTTNPRCANT